MQNILGIDVTDELVLHQRPVDLLGDFLEFSLLSLPCLAMLAAFVSRTFAFRSRIVYASLSLADGLLGQVAVHGPKIFEHIALAVCCLSRTPSIGLQ